MWNGLYSNFNSNIEEKLIGNYMDKWLVDKNISVHIQSNFFLKGFWTDGVSDKGYLKIKNISEDIPWILLDYHC